VDQIQRVASEVAGYTGPAEAATDRGGLMLSVLVVDHNRELLRIVTSWVDSFGYLACDAATADGALELLQTNPIAIAVCDAQLPGPTSGVWLAAQIRERHPDTAVIMAAALRSVDTAVASLRNEAVDYLLKPFTRERLSEALALAREWHAVEAGAEELHHALQDRLRTRRAAVAAALSEAQDTHEEALEGLISMLQLHERDGRGHATRVARLAVAIGDELGWDDELLLVLEHAALLHDIGKLEMPASILSKPAPLTEPEWQIMRTHPRVGYDLVQKQARFADAAEIVLSHHEAFDGRGYPRGLTGEQIPLGARVLSVADAFDSMTHPHTQRPPLPAPLALEEIDRCRGTQFDPGCTEALGAALAHAAEECVAS
jgi:putative nucleotidyltransferase with HDIG domain